MAAGVLGEAAAGMIVRGTAEQSAAVTEQRSGHPAMQQCPQQIVTGMEPDPIDQKCCRVDPHVKAGARAAVTRCGELTAGDRAVSHGRCHPVDASMS